MYATKDVFSHNGWYDYAVTLYQESFHFWNMVSAVKVRFALFSAILFGIRPALGNG